MSATSGKSGKVRETRSNKARPTRGDTLGEVAYQRVLAALFERKVAAGAFVSQRELVTLLDVPVQPLRDALKVLEADGLVTIHPRSGIQFVKPDLNFHHHTYQFRTIIERAAARRFAEVGDLAEIDRLIAEHRKLVATIESGPLPDDILDRMETLERGLHDAMIASLNNPLIDSAARRLKNYVLLIRLDGVMSKPFMLRTLAEHLEILQACADRDADAAERALVQHFQRVMGRLLGTG